MKKLREIMDRNEFSVSRLEQLTYRTLQQIAKNLDLPRNYKKADLVQLIYAKQYLTEDEVQSIIHRVKKERAAPKRRSDQSSVHLQGAEISSTQISPPISSTPKRRSILVRYNSPDRPLARAHEKGSDVKRTSPTRQSDRVLRSCNVKTYKRPNYSIMNSMFGIEDEEDGPPNKIREYHHRNRSPSPAQPSQPKVEMIKCVSKYRPSVLATSLLKTGKHKVQVYTRNQCTRPQPSLTFPMQTCDATTNYNYIKSVGFRRNDGKISKINAFVQKPKNNYIIETPSSQNRYRKEIYKRGTVNNYAGSRSLLHSGSTTQDFSLESGRSFLECTENMSMVKDSEPHYSRIPVYDLTEAEAIDVGLEFNDQQNLSPFTQERPSKDIEQSEVLNYPQISQQKAIEQSETSNYPQTSEQRAIERSEISNYPQISEQRAIERSEISSYPQISKQKAIEQSEISNYPQISEHRAIEQSEISIYPQISKQKAIEQSEISNYPQISEQRAIEQSEISNYPQMSEQKAIELPNFISNNEVTSTIKCDAIDGGFLSKLTEIYTNYPTLTKLTDTITYQRTLTSKLPEFTYTIPVRGFTDVLNHYSNMEIKTDFRETLTGAFSVHTHNNTQEQVRGRHSQEVGIGSLPHIGDVFSKFRFYNKDLNGPTSSLNVQGSYERGGYPSFTANSSTEALETLYNYSRRWLLASDTSHEKFPLVDTTYVVFTSKILITPVPTAHEAAPASAARPPSVSKMEPSMDCPDVGATVSIPDSPNTMMDDAMEIVSQDGDYMERLSMSERMRCVLCDWAGPKFVLEIHVKKEHEDQIQCQSSKNWVVTMKLGTLAGQPVWLSKVMQLGDMLYVLSVKYDDPDCLMAALTTLSLLCVPKSGSITVYNKVNGEPYTWEGAIEELPSNMPYEHSSNCLKLEISKLDLLPNSANLKLLNRKLVLTSPTKAIVGTPELDNIQVTFFVKIFD